VNRDLTYLGWIFFTRCERGIFSMNGKFHFIWVYKWKIIIQNVVCFSTVRMRPRKGRFEVVPYVGNKMFSSFGKKKMKKRNLFLEKNNYFWKKVFVFGKNSIFRKCIFYFWKKKLKYYFNNLMTWQFPRHINNLRGMGIFHWNKAPKFGSSKITYNPSLASFFF